MSILVGKKPGTLKTLILTLKFVYSESLNKLFVIKSSPVPFFNLEAKIVKKITRKKEFKPALTLEKINIGEH